MSLGAILINTGLCSDGLRLPSVTRRIKFQCFRADGSQKEVTGDVTTSTRVLVYAKDVTAGPIEAKDYCWP